VIGGGGGRAVDDFRVCSDLCEEGGFIEQARLLRSLADGGCKGYVVVERGYEYNDEIFAIEERGGEPREVFLDREKAERAAAERNIKMFREWNILAFCYGPGEISNYTPAELSDRIGKILGTDFQFPGDEDGDHAFDDYDRSLFPASATDEQMIEITKLFKNLDFFRVVETEIAPGDGPMAPGLRFGEDEP
jgi:hypothetical protein